MAHDAPRFTSIVRLSRWLMGFLVVGVFVGCLGVTSAVYPQAAQAATEMATPDGSALFAVHCASCHPQGKNIIRRGKSLQQRALKRYGYDTEAAIAQIITQGKPPMSSYGERFSPEEIQSLARYVLDQAQQTWP